MTMRNVDSILITGATGLVGGSVVLDLIAGTDATIYCLTRGDTHDDSERRTRSALEGAAKAYGRTDLIDQIRKRVRVLRGDVTSDYRTFTNCPGSVDLVIHAAASLKFADRDEEEIRRINVDGTANLLAMAAELGVRRFCHVSTAYVAGKRTGIVSESDPLPTDSELNNAYERSKVDGEVLVNGSGIPHQIVRPSIVIGHSSTLAATSFSGLYGLLDEVRRFKVKVAERLGHLLSLRGVRVLAEGDAEINLIPVDLVSQSIVRIALNGNDSTVYHLANGTPPTAGMCLGVGFEVLDLPHPEFVTRESSLNELDRRLQTEFYDTYLRNSKSFALENSETVCGVGFFDVAIDPTRFREYLMWYLESGNRRGGRLTA